MRNGNGGEVPESLEKVLVAAANAALRPLGFKGSRRTWLRDEGFAVAVVNLQKSAWGDMFYLNLGIVFDELGRPASIKEYRCHLRWRAPLREDPAKTLEAALDGDTRGLSNEDRQAVLRRYLLEEADPMLRRWSHLDVLAEDYRSRLLASAFVDRELRQFLDRPTH